MKLSVKWLKAYVDVKIPAGEIAEKLTMAGSEVARIDMIGGQWDKVVVGQIKAVNPHPNADRLRLPTLDLGTEEVTVVCGAPNLAVGQKVAFARVGAKVLDGHTGQNVVLKPAKIRGIESAGMVCSEKELALSDSHEGILVLPDDAPLGMPLAEYLGDAVIDLDITPNRPDCLSVLGLAHETAALTGTSVKEPDSSYAETGEPIDSKVKVEIQAPDLCPRYCASLVTGVKIAESPAWMQQRLVAAGARPINNIVDITNYVMLEYGQPLHSFDFSRINGGKIIVRRPREGELTQTLDGQDRTLSGDMLVIADERHTVAVAGVMGGSSSEVTDTTTDILLEAASFKPSSVHFTSRALGLTSEASMRFERGISAGVTMAALKRATQLLVELGGGQAAKGVIDVYPGKKQAQPVSLSEKQITRLLGIDIKIDDAIETLKSLGLSCEKQGADSLTATAPYWRSDIRITEDLIEEVARIRGYDTIPLTMLSQPIPRQNPSPVIALRKEVSETMRGLGFQEIVTFTLTGMDQLKKVRADSSDPDPKPLRVANPMSADQEFLRTDLRHNALAALASNRRHETGGIRLFEAGKVYIPRPADLPDEYDVLCAVLSGPRTDTSWHGQGDNMDFFDARGVVETLLGTRNLTAVFESSTDVTFNQSRQAAIVLNGEKIGVAGEVHPVVAARFELDAPVYMIEIDLRRLGKFAAAPVHYEPVPKFPSVVRDIALVLDASVPHQKIVDALKGFSLVQKVELFDVYQGEHVEAGKKSLAYHITYLSPTHTLTDSEVNGVQKGILAKLSQAFGATLRAQ